MSKKVKIEFGKRFGRLSIIKQTRTTKNRQRIFLCECSCGNKKEIQLGHLMSGAIKSCGCISKKHGMAQTRFYFLFKGLKQRCKNPRSKDYSIYGGKGIKCEWNDFISFRDDMYIKYLKHCKKYGEKNTTIDRINPNGNYSKNNCRWATKELQAFNKNSTIKYKGKSLSEWCRILDLKYSTARDRIKNRGKTIEEVLGF